MQPFRWGSVLIEIDGPTKVNRPETLKDNEGCSFLLVKCKYSSFRRVPLKGRVNQESAEELIVQSSFFHSCASQVAPSRYSARGGAGKRSEHAAGARTWRKSTESVRESTRSRCQLLNQRVCAKRVTHEGNWTNTSCTAEAPETYRLLMHYKMTKLKAVVSGCVKVECLKRCSNVPNSAKVFTFPTATLPCVPGVFQRLLSVIVRRGNESVSDSRRLSLHLSDGSRQEPPVLTESCQYSKLNTRFHL